MPDNRKQFEKIAHNLKQIRENTKRNTPITFAIIFTAVYAVYVHDDLEAIHKTGQAKFLEQPLRQYAKEITRRVKELLKQKRTLKQAILEIAQWFLENIVKPLVPVDTGNLRDSAIIKVIR